MDTTRLHNLMFLLASASVAAGCPADDASDDTAGDTGSTTTASTTTSTTASTTDGSGTSTTTDSDTTASTTASTTAPTTTSDTGTDTGTDTGSDTGSDTGTDTGTGGETGTDADSSTGDTGSAACAEFGATVAECYYDGDPAEAAYIEMYCNEYTEYSSMVGADCGLAYDEFVVCIGGSSCKELMDPPTCEAEQVAVEAACEPA